MIVGQRLGRGIVGQRLGEGDSRTEAGGGR